MRLRNINYRDPRCVCFVTFNLHPACSLRFTGETAHTARDLLWSQLHQRGCRLYGVCLMPDHVHLLLAPSGNGESVSDIVRTVKTWISCGLREQLGVRIRWQASFYDHVLRSIEKEVDEFDAILAYIHSNPARAGLGQDYPFRYRVGR